MNCPDPLPNPPQAREVYLAWAVSFALTFALGTLAGVVPLLYANLVVLYAAVFLFLPGKILRPSGRDRTHYGWHLRDAKRGLQWAVAITALTLIGFLPGFHLWLTQALPALRNAASDTAPQAFELDLDRGAYQRLPDAFWGQPLQPDVDHIYVYHETDRIFVQWRPTDAPWRLRIETDGELLPNRRLAAARTEPWFLEGRDPRLINVSFSVRGGERVEVSGVVAGEAVPPDRYRIGTQARPPRDRWVSPTGGLAVPLSPWWLLHLSMTQLLLIALPEEFFYRGYLQRRLDEARARVVWWSIGPLSFTRSNVIVSALFAIGHLTAEPSLGRLAVFFPSLLFGALRDKTDGLVAPVLFHAACNMMVQVVAVHYY